MGDKQEPNKIQECFRTIIAQIRSDERVLRKGPAGAKEDPALEVTDPAAGTGTRAARALSLRS